MILRGLSDVCMYMKRPWIGKVLMDAEKTFKMASDSSTMKSKLVIQLHFSAINRLPDNISVMSLTTGDKGMYFHNFSFSC